MKYGATLYSVAPYLNSDMEEEVKVLIVGGSGTIGIGLAKEALSRGYETYVLARGNHSDRIPIGSHVITANCRDIKMMKEVLKGLEFDVVVGGLVFTLPQLKIDIDIFGGKCKHYVFVSTTGVYSRDMKDAYLTEQAEYGCSEWSYNRNKIECEKYLKKNADKLPFNYTIIRPPVTYGDYRIPFAIVNRKNQFDLIRRIRDGKPIIACDNVEMAIAHLDDFSRGIVPLFMNPKAYGKAYHVTGDEIVRWEDVIAIVEEYCKKKAEVLHLPVDEFGHLDYQLYQEIKYNKSVPLMLSNEGIRTVIPDYKTYVSLREGVMRACQILEKEDKKEDAEWDLYIDALIYQGLTKRVFCAEEEKNARDYMTKCDIQMIEKYVLNHSKERYLKDYDVMMRWIALKQNGKKLSDYIKKYDYRTVAIYGMGEVGVLLYKELYSENIHVIYGIDQVGCVEDIDLEVIEPGTDLPGVDIIVVTVMHAYREIKEMLSEHVECAICSLAEIVYEINFSD